MKDSIKMMKGRDWEKTSANPRTEREIVSRLFKEMLQLNITKTTQFKNGQRSEQTFHQRRKTYGQEST